SDPDPNRTGRQVQRRRRSHRNEVDRWQDDTIGAEYITGEIPAELQKKAEAFHTALVETVAENDDDMLHKFLEGETISASELRASLRKSTIALKVFPVVVGTAFKNKGVQPLLDAVV